MTGLVSKGKGWWDANGYNMDRWNNMPYKQRYAIAKKASSKGWPMRNRSSAETSDLVQMSLFE
jgi:hypothetical protein